ncbi:Caspase-3 [Bulinus truncatus]|nr:Caspase-3 [Bulinus truncatus]
MSNNLDYIDAIGDSGNSSAQPNRRVYSSLTEDEFFSDTYKMDYANRGIAVIFNNYDFIQETNLPKRTGSEKDEDSIYYLMNTLGFEQIKIKRNRTCPQMEADLKEVADEDHSTNSCFACIILSYGEEGYVYGTDNKIALESLFDPFKGNNCLTLVGKPKIFIIQACPMRIMLYREESDSGVMEEEFEELEEEVGKIPTEADFLVVYSDVPGSYGWSKKENSWFIQSICEAFETYWSKKDVLTIMTAVLRKMEEHFEKSKRQALPIPCITSMLTKSLYFKQ